MQKSTKHMTKHGGKKVFVETTGRNSGKKCGKGCA